MADTYLTPAEASKILGCDQQTLRVAAHLHPEKLGFPVIIIGRRVKIPREAFERFMRGDLLTEKETL